AVSGPTLFLLACLSSSVLFALFVSPLFFFFNDPPTPEIYTLSLHDALPISILASLLVRLVVLLPFQLLRLSLATPSRWTPLALSVFLHCVVALLLTLL